MPAWYGRWMLFVLFSVVWWNYPRTMYCLIWIIDLIFLGFAVVSMGGFKGPIGILVVVEEFLLLLWHFSMFILMVDYYKEEIPGIGKMSKKATGWWVYFIFISSIICAILEIVIFVLGIILKDKAAADDDFNLSESENGLENNIKTYKTAKMGNADGEERKGDEEVNQANE